MERSIFLLLGSNEGDRALNLARARQLLEEHAGKIITTSSIYKTEPWGKQDQQEFYNQVIEITADLKPFKLLETVLEIEQKLGRVRLEKWGSRIIDIDILLMGDQIIHTEALQIPHPEIPNRKFTLVPLEEIAQDFVHPLLKKKIKTLTQECSDSLQVTKLEMT
jgi:2-amino-4-hydroxy-6-hydroxymethyldihydropteridine diphosphokinase